MSSSGESGTRRESSFAGPRQRRRQPVLVLPGFGGSDRSTVGLRTHIGLLGHPAHRWRLGRNEGPTREMLEGLRARFQILSERYEVPIALVGWSLGGVYAWDIAKRMPESVQQVITLGSPLNSTGMVESPPPVPLTSIWSRNDRVVGWQSSSIEPGYRRENIEVRSTHLTLGFDPMVMAVITDRLGQQPGRWMPFSPPPWLDRAFP